MLVAETLTCKQEALWVAVRTGEVRSPGGWLARAGPLSPSCTVAVETEREDEDKEERQVRMKQRRRRNLLVVELHDGLLQVAHSAVDQLGAAAARPRGEIAALHQGGPEVCGEKDKNLNAN